jgi:mannosyltransferase
MNPSDSKRSAIGLLLLLLIAGCWLRVWRIGSNSLWFDEAFTRDVAVYGNPLTIARNEIGDLHPPLYFVLLSIWVRLAGDSEVSLRALSAFAAMLALPAFYHLGRLLFNRRAGTVALILGAFSPLQIYYAQEVRNYMLSITMAAWMLVGLVALLRGKRYGWPIFVLAALGGLYTHYFTGLLLVAVNLWLLLYRPARQQWRRWLPADIVIAVLYVPQLSPFIQQSQAVIGSFWIDKPNPAAPITTLTFLLFGTSFPHSVDFIPILVLMVVLVIAALDIFRKAPRRIRPYWLLCAASILVVLLSVMGISLVRSSIYLDKSFGLLSPLLIAAIAGSVAYARRPSPVPWLTALLVVLMIVGVLNHAFVPDPAKPPFRQIAADLLARPDALSVPILYLHDSLPLSMDYYAPALTRLARVVNLEDRSWLWPQGAVFPQTWHTFGIDRLSRDQIADWLAGYHGPLRVFVSAALEPPEQATLLRLLKSPCTRRMTSYGPFVSLYEFECT